MINGNINWGIWGCGAVVAKSFVPAVRVATKHRIVAVCASRMESARGKATAIGAARAYDDPEAFLRDPEIDAVYIAKPPALHAEHIIRAAAAGKHILCEKPLALDPPACRRAIAAVDAAGVRLAVCFYMRFNQCHQRLKQAIDSGALGEITGVEIHNSTWHPPSTASWRHDPAIGGGGVLFDLGCHCIDLLRYLLGEITLVSGHTARVHPEARVDEVTTAQLRFARGTLGLMNVSFACPKADDLDVNFVRIYGTRGTAFAGPINTREEPGNLRINHAEPVPLAQPWMLPHARLLDAFAAGLTGEFPVDLATAHDGLRNQEIMEAIYASDRSLHALSLPAKSMELP